MKIRSVVECDYCRAKGLGYLYPSHRPRALWVGRCDRCERAADVA